MADGTGESFGRFLRSLRQRRGLSLLDVEKLNDSVVFSIDKGTLSRFERGAQRLPATAITPLAAVYGVAPQVLLDRLDLDEHADRRVRDLDELSSHAELRDRAVKALIADGDRWTAYACFRRALEVVEADGAGPEPSGADAEAAIRFNLASVARGLGKNHLALYELESLEQDDALDDRHIPILLDRMANGYRCIGNLDKSERILSEAVRASAAAADARSRAFVDYSSAVLAHTREDWEACLAALRLAFRGYRRADGEGALVPDPSFEINVLLKAADAYLQSGATARSKVATFHARRLALAHAKPQALGYCEVQLGEIAERSGDRERARAHWSRAIGPRGSAGNPRIRFAAGFFLYKDALGSGHPHRARRYRARLDRWISRVPSHLPIVADYRRTRQVAE